MIDTSTAEILASVQGHGEESRSGTGVVGSGGSWGNSGGGGLVEGVGAGLKGIRHLADVAALDDGKQQSDLAVTAQFDAFRHDGIPIAANGGEDLRQVGAGVQ